ncbi:carbonyl reductase [NADPH] 1, partial [Plakobranchus ocellatus]
RDDSRGQAAVQALEKEGLHPKYHQLDINDHSSIVRLRDFLQNTYQGLDVLVNNAGILYQSELHSEVPATAPFPEMAEKTCQTNFFATLDVCEVLFSILRPHARVCNMSSGLGRWSLEKVSQSLKDRLLSSDIDMEELINIVRSFVKAAQEDKHLEQGFSDNAYGMSKLCLTVMSTIQQRELDKKGAEDIVVNACTPGLVATDMTNHKGITIDEGAVTPVFAVLLPPNISEPRGKFLRNKEISEGMK